MAMESYALGLAVAIEAAKASDKMEGPDPWWGTRYQKICFLQLARKHSILNFKKNIQRETYANSPIAKYLQGLRRPQQEGRVHVAFVPPGKGQNNSMSSGFQVWSAG
jgi:hypothetical protein